MTRTMGPIDAPCAVFRVRAAFTLVGAAAGRPRRSDVCAPEDAVKALPTRSRRNVDALLASSVPKAGAALIRSRDRSHEPSGVRDRVQGAVGISRDTTPTEKTLVVGNEDWPFPVPLVNGQARCGSTRRGKEEVLARRSDATELQNDRDTPAGLRHRAAALRATVTRRQARRDTRDQVPERSRQGERPILADRARPEAESAR
jgi:hypothetical protein